MGKVSDTYNLAVCNPEIAKYWHPTKNGNITPYDVTPMNGNKYWFLCEKGHDAYVRVANQTRKGGIGCPVCKGYSIIQENCLSTLNPELAKEWHPVLNGDLTPSDVPVNYSKKVWWVCLQGHEYDATVAKRNYGNGCPYCAGKRVSVSNSLEAMYPNIAKEWHPTRNNSTTPADIVPGTPRKYWWICPNGHEYDCPPVARINGTNCRFCEHQEASIETCLATKFPDVAKMWHPTLNNNLTTYNVLPKSKMKVYWLCEFGHVTYTSIRSRTNSGKCSECQKGRQTSFPEQAIFYYLSKVYPWTKNRFAIMINSENFEADVYIPQLKLVIEYDGYYHRYSLERDIYKTSVFLQNNLNVIRIRDSRLPKLNLDDVVVIDHYKRGMESLKQCISNIVDCIMQKYDLEDDTKNALSKLYDVNIEHNEAEILSSVRFVRLENSLASTHPEIASEWNYELNGGITPSDITFGVNTKFYWNCPNGHIYFMSVNKRVAGCNCNKCAGKILTDEKSLANTYPDLCAIWDCDSNEISPNEVSYGSDMKVFWKCSKGHVYDSSVSSMVRGIRSGKLGKCPYCAGQKVCDDNCLATVNPKLAAEWDYDKNDGLTPRDVTAGANRKVYWKCANGHSFYSLISSRNVGVGCKQCYEENRRKKKSIQGH